MADQKISSLTELATTPANDDLLVIVDTSDTTQAPTGTTKKIQASNARAGLALSGAVTSSGLTMATSRLLGRTTAGTGAVEEITVGSGLSLSAGSLTATGSGGGIVLQSNKVIDTTARSTTNTSYEASGVEVALSNNLKDTNSRVRVSAFFSAGASSTVSLGEYTLYSWDGSSAVDLTPATMTGMAVNYTHAATYISMVAFTFEHTPGSTTPLTYRLYFKTSDAARTQFIGRRGNDTVYLSPTVLIVEELD